MLSAVLVASIAVAVILGYKTKINTGFFCIAFAYLIGCFGMGLKTKELIGFWPVSTLFVILSVSLFYNFAAVNGTLEKMSASLLYMCRKFPGMLPFALFFVAVVLSVMGAAYFTVLAFLAPITILICEEAKMDKLTGAVAINCGALAGGNFPTASLGVVFRGLIDTAYESEAAIEATNSFVDEMKIFAFAIVFSLILIAIFRFGFKSSAMMVKQNANSPTSTFPAIFPISSLPGTAIFKSGNTRTITIIRIIKCRVVFCFLSKGSGRLKVTPFPIPLLLLKQPIPL